MQMTSDVDPENMYNQNIKYVTADLRELYFTGYTRNFLGNTTGYYYYTMRGGKCFIVLLSPRSSQMGLSYIESLSGDYRIIRDSKAMDMLLTNLAHDLTWNDAGIRDAVSPYMLSESDANGLMTDFLRFFLLISIALAVVTILISTISIIKPELSRPIRRLSVYGNPKEILEEAEDELATLPQLATEDMFITEHYFIETTKDGVALVPIDRILWIYKYSTLHKILWHHFSISYTLYINAERHRYIRCPKNTKTDIDGIMDYLSEANHNIYVGFSEENRRRIEARQGDLIFLRKIWAFLSRKV